MQNSAGGKSATAMKWAIAGFAIIFALLSAPAAALAVSALEPARTVVVDAGHGGMDGGVTGVNTGVKESDLNLVMAKLLGEYLKSGGFDVVYTRRTSGGLYKEGDVNKKSADMHRRAEIISRADPVAVVSIHMNTFFQRSRRGAQVFFDPSSAKGESLALAVQEPGRGEGLFPSRRGQVHPATELCALRHRGVRLFVKSLGRGASSRRRLQGEIRLLYLCRHRRLSFLRSVRHRPLSEKVRISESNVEMVEMLRKTRLIAVCVEGLLPFVMRGGDDASSASARA